MKTLLFTFSIISLFTLKVHSQPGIEWQNTIGGTDRDDLNSVIQTLDGNYVLAGVSKSDSSGDKTENNIGGINDFYDYWILKIDSTGNILWQNTIGGEESEYLKCIRQTEDGGFILCGYSNSNNWGDKSEPNFDPSLLTYDYWIIKLDANGIIIWENTIGGTGDDKAFGIEITSDNGFLITGWSDSPVSGDKTEAVIGGLDCWLIKLDSFGNIVWQNTIGGSLDDKLFSIHEITNGYLLGGGSASDISGDKTENSKGGYDFWVLLLDFTGNVTWQKTIGGNADDFLYSVQLTPGSEYFMAGTSSSGISGDKLENNIGGIDLWAVKTDISGNLIWQNTLGGTGDDICSFGFQNADGTYFMGGWSDSDSSSDKSENSIGGFDYWIANLDPNGALQWENTIGGSAWDILTGAIQTNDGGYLLSGYSGSNISGDKTEDCHGIPYDYWVVKLFPSPLNAHEHSSFSNSVFVYPNPVVNQVTISAEGIQNKLSAKLFDCFGKEIYSWNNLSNPETLPLFLNSGIYILQVKNDQQISVQKIVVK